MTAPLCACGCGHPVNRGKKGWRRFATQKCNAQAYARKGKERAAQRHAEHRAPLIVEATRMQADGITDVAIARAIGVSNYRTLWKWRKKGWLPRRVRAPGQPPPQRIGVEARLAKKAARITQATALQTAGHTDEQIATAIGVKPSTLEGWRYEGLLPRRSKPPRISRPTKRWRRREIARRAHALSRAGKLRLIHPSELARAA